LQAVPPKAGNVLATYCAFGPYSGALLITSIRFRARSRVSARSNIEDVLMLPEKKYGTNIGVGIGIVLQLIGRMMQLQSDDLMIVGLVLILVGAVFFIWGCVNYCQGKGYPGAFGLLGLLSCVGLLILVVLPDKHK
jgi:hypothetical protein